MGLVCASCGKGILRDLASQVSGAGPVPDAERDSHGICLMCLPEAYGVPIENVATLDPAELDALPYGVVRMDATGVVIAYNAVESRITRRSPEQTLGLDFFRVVAPCANVEALSGWLARQVASGLPGQTSLDFVFVFPWGREFVDLRLSWDATERVATLLVEQVARETELAAPTV